MYIYIWGRCFSLLGEKAQWEKLLGMIDYYFYRPTTVAAVFILVIGVVCVIQGTMKSKTEDIRAIIYKKAALISYLIIIFLLSVLNRDRGEERILRLTLDPWFASNTTYHESNVLIAVFNAGYFIPFGALVRWQDQGELRYRLFAVILITGVIVEFLQYILIRGVASVEDVVAYMTGGTIGIVLVSLFGKIMRQFGFYQNCNLLVRR